MRQQIVIPWRDAGCTYRRHHFNFLCDYYSDEFDIIVANNAGEFNRSAARNVGVSKTQCNVAVVIDADNYISHAQIYEAVEKANKTGKLVKPFSIFGYLTEDSTDMFYEFYNIDGIEFEPSYIDPPQHDFTGGAYVMKKDIWQNIGGMDEGFVGWGAEDDAFHIICKKRLGRIHIIEGNDFHLYHPAHRVTSEYNYDKLMREYVRNKRL